MTTPAMPALTLLAHRVTQLEQQNRLFKCAGMLLLLLLGSVTLVAAQERGKGQTIEAERFVLKDANGRMRADLGMDKNGGVRFVLYDENEKQRLNAASFNEGPGLALFDENGAVRFSVSQSNRGPSLVFNDENQKPHVIRLSRRVGIAFLDEKRKRPHGSFLDQGQRSGGSTCSSKPATRVFAGARYFERTCDVRRSAGPGPQSSIVHERTPSNSSMRTISRFSEALRKLALEMRSFMVLQFAFLDNKSLAV